MSQSAEDHLEDAQLAAYKACYEWSGPNEAKEHLMNALAELAYADMMWRAASEPGGRLGPPEDA